MAQRAGNVLNRRVLESIVTTINPDGTVNVSPMGPIVDDAMDEVLLRPYQTSTTYNNLCRTRQGVLHVTDDVELFARAAVNCLEKTPLLIRAEHVDGYILAEACRWFAFRIESIDDSKARAEMRACVVDRGRLRDFFGFNRAKHAVIEASILASRVGLLPRREILAELERLASPVQKTAGEQERRAFAFLVQFIRSRLGGAKEE